MKYRLPNCPLATCPAVVTACQVFLVVCVVAAAGCGTDGERSSSTGPSAPTEHGISDVDQQHDSRNRGADADQHSQPDGTLEDVKRCRKIYETMDVDIDGQQRAVSVVSVGLLKFPTGIINLQNVVDDNAGLEGPVRLGVEIAPGNYPVDYSYVSFEDGTRRNVAAWIRLADPDTVERWIPVVNHNGNGHRLSIKGNRLAMFDASVISKLSNGVEVVESVSPAKESMLELRERILESKASGFGAFAVKVGSFAKATDERSDDLAVFEYDSGAQSASFFWGLDRSGKPAVMLIDFELID